ncbi:hypothetical protein AA309_30690 [Microvirga vignae]|uniref:Uncharacterized protein n=1 Tax=Microvirga vignae TaxID=1225564 RepID=A0A0H1RAD9_9HYPH|nr:hypothetical protein AA309_30690 [Microvirga vignae]
MIRYRLDWNANAENTGLAVSTGTGSNNSVRRSGAASSIPQLSVAGSTLALPTGFRLVSRLSGRAAESATEAVATSPIPSVMAGAEAGSSMLSPIPAAAHSGAATGKHSASGSDVERTGELGSTALRSRSRRLRMASAQDRSAARARRATSMASLTGRATTLVSGCFLIKRSGVRVALTSLSSVKAFHHPGSASPAEDQGVSQTDLSRLVCAESSRF